MVRSGWGRKDSDAVAKQLHVSFYAEELELLQQLARLWGCTHSEALRTVVRSYAAFISQQPR